MTSNLIPRPNTELSSEVFTKKTSLIARGLNEISLLKPTPESLYQTGMDYFEGSNGKPWDILKAYAYLVKSAEQGFVLAQWRLACIFFGKEAIEKNEEKSVYWLEKAALNGHLKAMYYLLDETSETYIEELTYLAESGCSPALRKLVHYYLTGDYERIEKDMKQAWYWVKRSIEQGDNLYAPLKNATAEFWDEVDKDNRYWLRYDWLCEDRYSAAEREQYYENRMMWLIEKAQQGEAFAQLQLGAELHEINHNLGTFFSKNWQLVICEKLLHQHAAIAAHKPIDWAKLAIFWFTKPAKQGFWKAIVNLGFLFDDIDHEKALYWHRKRAEFDSFTSYYFEAILAFNATDRDDAPKFTFEELEHYRLNNQDSI